MTSEPPTRCSSAAALFAAEGQPSSLEFVSLDDRLLAVAQREGFTVRRPAVDGR